MGVNPAPAAGPVPYGSAVDIQVYAGVPQVKVPDVTGKKTSDAKKILEAAGLKVEATDWFGDKVLRQNPKAGTTVDVGTSVKILSSFF
jgi:eukaryotic-like serine/threonine-protein kinase